MAWSDASRWMRPKVIFGSPGRDITNYVSSISVTEHPDTPVSSASIALSHEDIPFLRPGSLSVPGQALQIWLLLRTADLSEWRLLFSGTTEAGANSDPLLPMATLTAVSKSAVWAAKKGCLLVSPFAGYTRVELLQAMASQMGTILTVTGDYASTVVRKPIDVADVTLIDLFRIWLPLDGAVFRESEGGLEILPFAQVAGPDAEAMHAFTPSNYLSAEESPPARQATDLILWGSEPVLLPEGEQDPIEVLDGGTGPAKTVTTRTITDGVVTQEVTERWENYAVKGVTNAAPAFLLISRTTANMTFGTTPGGKPNGRLASKTTTVESYYSPKTSTAGYVWEGETDTYHVDESESFQETAKVEEEYIYADCVLSEGRITRTGWLAAISEPAYSDPEEAWPDGTTRDVETETYRTASKDGWVEVYWAPGDTIDLASQQAQQLNRAGLYPPHGKARARWEEQQRHGGRVNGTKQTAWHEASDGLTHIETVLEGTEAHGHWVGVFDGAGSVPGSPRSVAKDGPIPAPVFQSPTVRMFALRPILVTARATTPLPRQIESAQIVEAESVAELERLAKWRFRTGASLRMQVLHPYMPGIRPWAPVLFTGTRRKTAGSAVSVRNLVSRPAFVGQVETTIEAGSGGWGLCSVLQKTGLSIDLYAGSAP